MPIRYSCIREFQGLNVRIITLRSCWLQITSSYYVNSEVRSGISYFLTFLACYFTITKIAVLVLAKLCTLGCLKVTSLALRRLGIVHVMCAFIGMGEEIGGCIESWWGNRRERDHWGDLGIDGWIILRRISRRWDVVMWTGLGWPKIETDGGRL